MNHIYREGNDRTKRLGFFGLSVILFLLTFRALSLTSWIKGDLGDIHNIVASVISKYFAQCTGAEARSALDSLGPEKKNALINFLGEPGKVLLLTKCPKDICSVVKTFNPGKPVSEDEFKKMYPDILDILQGRLPVVEF